jgi:hypothetical protein
MADNVTNKTVGFKSDKMKNGDNLIRVYTGSEVLVILLKEWLEEIGISALIKNDYQSGITVGFVASVPSAIDLYIQESDLKEAEPIINKFIQDNPE